MSPFALVVTTFVSPITERSYKRSQVTWVVHVDFLAAEGLRSFPQGRCATPQCESEILEMYFESNRYIALTLSLLLIPVGCGTPDQNKPYSISQSEAIEVPDKIHTGTPPTNHTSVRVPPGESDPSRLVRLVNDLATIPPELSTMGPVHGIKETEETRAVVMQGQSIVPALVSALDRSSWNHTVYIVYCLRLLRARDARDRIVGLQTEIKRDRFASEPHDFSLDVLIESYLREIDK